MSRKRGVLLALASIATVLLIVASVFMLGRSPDVESAKPNQPNQKVAGVVELQTSETEEPEAADGRIQVTLFVMNSSGRGLVPVTHEIPLEPNLQDQAKEVVRVLLQRSGTFPRGVQLRDLFITSQGMAFVDLSQDVVSKHPGGSSAEELTVYSLSNTLITNFPAIQLVKILVEGREIQTLAGHLDLTLPYGRDESASRTGNPGA